MVVGWGRPGLRHRGRARAVTGQRRVSLLNRGIYTTSMVIIGMQREDGKALLGKIQLVI